MHDAFISYKSEDSALALQVRDTLESNGIPCWIAERDIQPGSNYAADIPAAIESCKVLVLILTENAQTSPWIPKEIDSAIASRKTILPLLIGQFQVNHTMSFLLTGIQYHDATENLTKTVIQLVPQIKASIAAAGLPGKRRKKKPNVIKTRCHNFLYFLLTLVVLVIVLHLLGVDVLSYFPPQVREPVGDMIDKLLRPILELFT